MTDTEKRARSVTEMVRLATSTDKIQRYGCVNPPLLSFVDVTDVIPNVLHLMLRNFDHFMDECLDDLQQYDLVHNGIKKHLENPNSKTHLFGEIIRNSGVPSFRLVDKGEGKVGFASLSGYNRETILNSFPVSQHLPEESKP